MTEKLENDEAGIRWEYINFLKLLKEAKSEAEVVLVAQIAKAGQKDWRANAFILERRNPDDWGIKDRGETSEDKTNKIIFEDEEVLKIDESEYITTEEEEDSGGSRKVRRRTDK